ncbi:fanconi anemia group b protein [Anaeramoeba flamelloides]|uniref:Fanconi anemia group b protein n=1 Tax=Anaeramoeba flamelloides TaxID=1746091 RepID=A0ABQ8XFT2_9EUKA|nr:fanconi anemia group b protein [Anaeramoeba flamelloides]
MEPIRIIGLCDMIYLLSESEQKEETLLTQHYFDVDRSKFVVVPEPIALKTEINKTAMSVLHRFLTGIKTVCIGWWKMTDQNALEIHSGCFFLHSKPNFISLPTIVLQSEQPAIESPLYILDGPGIVFFSEKNTIVSFLYERINEDSVISSWRTIYLPPLTKNKDERILDLKMNYVQKHLIIFCLIEKNQNENQQKQEQEQEQEQEQVKVNVLKKFTIRLSKKMIRKHNSQKYNEKSKELQFSEQIFIQRFQNKHLQTTVITQNSNFLEIINEKQSYSNNSNLLGSYNSFNNNNNNNDDDDEKENIFRDYLIIIGTDDKKLLIYNFYGLLLKIVPLKFEPTMVRISFCDDDEFPTLILNFKKEKTISFFSTLTWQIIRNYNYCKLTVIGDFASTGKDQLLLVKRLGKKTKKFVEWLLTDSKSDLTDYQSLESESLNEQLTDINEEKRIQSLEHVELLLRNKIQQGVINYQNLKQKKRLKKSLIQRSSKIIKSLAKNESKSIETFIQLKPLQINGNKEPKKKKPNQSNLLNKNMNQNENGHVYGNDNDNGNGNGKNNYLTKFKKNIKIMKFKTFFENLNLVVKVKIQNVSSTTISQLYLIGSIINENSNSKSNTCVEIYPSKSTTLFLRMNNELNFKIDGKSFISIFLAYSIKNINFKGNNYEKKIIDLQTLSIAPSDYLSNSKRFFEKIHHTNLIGSKSMDILLISKNQQEENSIFCKPFVQKFIKKYYNQDCIEIDPYTIMSRKKKKSTLNICSYIIQKSLQIIFIINPTFVEINFKYTNQNLLMIFFRLLVNFLPKRITINVNKANNDFLFLLKNCLDSIENEIIDKNISQRNQGQTDIAIFNLNL